MPLTSVEVRYAYSASLSTEARRGSARRNPDPGRAAQPAWAAAKVARVFTPLKQKTEASPAGVSHPLSHAVRF